MNEISITPADETAPAHSSEIDPVKLEQMMRELKARQSIVFAVLGGLAASVAAAAVWAAITYATGYQIGFMAVGVGIVVGFAVNFCGKGMTPVFGVVGAVLALFGCLLGNLFTAVIAISQVEDVSMLVVALGIASAPSIVAEIFKETFSPIDLLFYGIAIYEGYKFSIRQLTDEETASLQKGVLTSPSGQ